MSDQTQEERPDGYLITFTKSGTYAQSATLTDYATEEPIHDLLMFIEVAQALGIDFLPITWQPTSDGIGLGATGTIAQSMVNGQTALAFKVFRSKQVRGGSLEASKIYRALIAEITVLGHAWIRQGPYVVQLEGICWDVDIETEEIWPVLVFRRSDEGDLQTFMKARRHFLIIDYRLALCINIGLALRDMHYTGTVHGDIKPENVLIFAKESDQKERYYLARLTDFGYSTWCATPDDLVFMPRTSAWCAPEWHHRAFSVADAMRMDVFSFGQLCLWILFCNGRHDPPEEFEKTIDPENRNLQYAQTSIAKLDDLSDRNRGNLNQFFQLSLAVNPLERGSNMTQLVSLLLPESLDGHPLLRQMDLNMNGINSDFPKGLPSYGAQELRQQLPFPPETFRLDLLYKQLCYADFRIRPFIFACLENRLSESSSLESAQNTAFQISLCHKVGFGISRNDVVSHSFLLQSGKGYEDLQKSLEMMKKTNLGVFFRHFVMADLIETEGSFESLNVAQSYMRDHLLDKALVEIKREIKDTEEVLGAESNIVAGLKASLGLILTNQRNWSELEQLVSERLEETVRTQGRMDPESLTAMAYLAKAYYEQGKYVDAEKIQSKVLRGRTDVLGKEHPATLMSLRGLAVLRLREGEYEVGERLIKTTLTKLRKILGKAAFETCKTMSLLAEAYEFQGQWTKAQAVYSELLTIRQSNIGQEHPNTLQSMADLARTYDKGGQWEEAEALYMHALEAHGRTFAKGHPATLEVMDHLINIYDYQHDYTKGAELTGRKLKIQQETLGGEHPETLDSMNMLVIYYWNEREWQEAEELNIHVLGTRRRLLGEDHPDTLTSMIFLAVTCLGLNRMEKAIALLTDSAQMSTAVLGPRHPLSLARTELLEKWRCESAVDVSGEISSAIASLDL